MSTRALRFGWLLAVTLGAGVACSDASDTATSTLAGRTFISTTIVGSPIPGGGPLTLTFDTDRISGNAGCNTGRGTATFDDGMLRVTELQSTLMGCPGERANADRWLSDLLGAAPRWELVGDRLTVRTASRTVTLLDKSVAKPDKPLRGTNWLVIGLLTPDAQVTSQTIDQAKPALSIAEDGNVLGSTGCNRMTGNAVIETAPTGSDITFRLGVTEMACAPEVMAIERSVLRAVTGVVHATVDADILTMRNGDGNGLTLRAH